MGWAMDEGVHQSHMQVAGITKVPENDYSALLCEASVHRTVASQRQVSGCWVNGRRQLVERGLGLRAVIMVTSFGLSQGVRYLPTTYVAPPSPDSPVNTA